MEEDELARIREIFKAFDQTGKGRVPTERLSTVLRLLNINMYEREILELEQLMEAKRKKNYFHFEDLVELLRDYHFLEDTEADLLGALRELDEDGDGLIPIEEMARFLTTMGETFTEEEINDFLAHAVKAQPTERALDDSNASIPQKPLTDHVDIVKLASLMMPVLNLRMELVRDSQLLASQDSALMQNSTT